MVDIITYDFKLLIYNKVKPEESFINAYVGELLESEGKMSSTRRILIVLDAKYEKADLNQVMDEQCQQLSHNKR